jgi:sugar phosphate isomerase/epimerase
MNIIISNLTWSNENEALSILNELGISKIECAPTKIDSWDNLNNKTIISYKDKINQFGIDVYSMQSLFYGTDIKSLNEVDKVIEHFKKLIEYSEILGVKILVFGSPGLRKNNPDTQYSLRKIFDYLDPYLQGKGITICIEPNCRIYKGEFFIKMKEIVDFVNQYNNIRTMIDTHNLFVEEEPLNDSFLKYKSFISHIHLSEVGMIPLDYQKYHDFVTLVKSESPELGITYEAINLKDFRTEIENFKKLI